MDEKNYDVNRYLLAREKVKDARKRIDLLPEQVQEECLSIIRQAVSGTLDSCKEIYDPDAQVINYGTSGDRETDRKGLADLPAFFE